MATLHNDEQSIRERAYQIWEREGKPQGRDKEHWHQARRELEAEAENGGKSQHGNRH